MDHPLRMLQYNTSPFITVLHRHTNNVSNLTLSQPTFTTVTTHTYHCHDPHSPSPEPTVHHLHHQQITARMISPADTLDEHHLVYLCIVVTPLAVKQHETVHQPTSSELKLGHKAAQNAFPASYGRSAAADKDSS